MKKMDKVKAIAFDLDGTLVDSLPGLAQAVDLVMVEAGLAAPGKDRVRDWVGNGPFKLIEHAIHWGAEEVQQHDLQHIRERFEHYYNQTLKEGTQLYPGVLETLGELAQQGWSMAVVTNKPTVFVPSILRSLGMAPFFGHVIGGSDTPVHKPHPAALYLLLGRVGLLPEQLLMVGDSRNDIQAARAAGCPCVGVSYGYNHGEPVSDYHPDWLLHDFSDLLSLLPSENAKGKNK
ncbi:MAG: phosphoglycolate phosphatase [Enterobacteriaceae bacterium]